MQPISLSPSSQTSRGAAVAVRDLFKIFKVGELQTVALRGISIEIQPGEFVAIVGRSGSGKSTLFSLLAGLAEPSAGEIWLDGQRLSDLPERERARLRREHVGVTFQRDNLVPFLSALENVEFPLRVDSKSGAKAARDRAGGLLAEMGLEGRMHHRAAQLSGGEQARVALAMALANRPGLLLADEPTGELDTQTAEEVMGLLESLNRTRGLTLLVVTHNPEVARRAHRVVHIRDGSLEVAA